MSSHPAVMLHRMGHSNLWRAQDVAEYLNVARSTVYHFRHTEPDFPAPVRLAANAVRWRPEDIYEWTRRRRTDDRSQDRGPGRPRKPIAV